MATFQSLPAELRQVILRFALQDFYPIRVPRILNCLDLKDLDTNIYLQMREKPAETLKSLLGTSKAVREDIKVILPLIWNELRPLQWCTWHDGYEVNQTFLGQQHFIMLLRNKLHQWDCEYQEGIIWWGLLFNVQDYNRYLEGQLEMIRKALDSLERSKSQPNEALLLELRLKPDPSFKFGQ